MVSIKQYTLSNKSLFIITLYVALFFLSDFACECCDNKTHLKIHRGDTRFTTSVPRTSCSLVCRRISDSLIAVHWGLAYDEQALTETI